MFNYGSSSGSPSSSNSNADLSRSYTVTWDDQNRPRGSGGGGDSSSQQGGGELELARLKARILAHPLYEQLLAAHVACLRAATPASHFHRIDATLANCHHIAAQHLALHAGAAHFPGGPPSDKDDLDLFMVNYILLLQTFKEQLQQHVTIQASEAIAACWEMEKALYNLTGVSIEEGGDALMPEDEMEEEELQSYGGGGGTGGTMPLVRLGLDSFQQPTDAEKSLLHHVRRELKNELKKEYQSKLKDVREEILRKRRAGKLPGDTANVLKDWWNAHSKWPYPTEEEKARLVEETGLELKQINNWFINQRKRNWQTENIHAAAVSSDTFSSYDGHMQMSSDNQPLNVSLSLRDASHPSKRSRD